MPWLGPQYMPIIKVINKTERNLKDIYFTYKGNNIPYYKINKINSGEYETTVINTLKIIEPCDLIMYYYDCNKTKHEHIIVDNLSRDNLRDIFIDIEGINYDNSYNLKSYYYDSSIKFRDTSIFKFFFSKTFLYFIFFLILFVVIIHLIK